LNSASLFWERKHPALVVCYNLFKQPKVPPDVVANCHRVVRFDTAFDGDGSRAWKISQYLVLDSVPGGAIGAFDAGFARPSEALLASELVAERISALGGQQQKSPRCGFAAGGCRPKGSKLHYGSANCLPMASFLSEQCRHDIT
jgi:hypothetical protein